MRRALFLSLAVAACGDDAVSIDDFLPPAPVPDGTPRSVFAGVVADSAELIPGPASVGKVGDYYIRNSRVRFVIQGPTRAIGPAPWGGNVVDATLVDGTPLDQLGKISFFYDIGRACAHDSVEVVADGAGGGAAMIRARGRSAPNDYINIRGMALPVIIPVALDPDVADGFECATTYTLEPDSDRLHVAWTIFNTSDKQHDGPLGALNDPGGEVTTFGPRVGFRRTSASSVLSPSGPTDSEYVLYQGPDVAYGFVPRHADPTTRDAGVVVGGVSFLIFGVDSVLDLVRPEEFFLHIAAHTGVTFDNDLIVARDAAGIDEAYRRRQGEPLLAVSGQVTLDPGGAPAVGARVGVFSDDDGDGALGADDLVRTYFSVGDDGSFGGFLPAGSFLLRADLDGRGASAASEITLAAPRDDLALSIPAPAVVDYTVVDDATGEPVPARLVAVGRSPSPRDVRVFDTYEDDFGVAAAAHTLHGTSLGAGPADLPLLLPAGASYRLFATHGPEWSVASAAVTAVAGESQSLELRLVRVVDTSGYLATEFHQHTYGSPDSSVSYLDRVGSLIAEGVEFFAATDHDYVSDYGPAIAELGVGGLVAGVPGEEATSFVYGHFNAYPMNLDAADPARGAVDWPTSVAFPGYAMLPAEIWAGLRARGARVVQVNHPRQFYGSDDFMGFFERAGVAYDFSTRAVVADPLLQPVPSDYLRLPPGESLYSDGYDAIEIWNGLSTDDSNDDGVREVVGLDVVLRDYMNLLSLGFVTTPVANSDTHTAYRDPVGLPRTYVAVPDDSPAALAAGVAEDVWATLGGAAPRDVVLSNGPFIRVTVGGATAIGREIAASGGTATLAIDVTAPAWASFDTVEVFANHTFDEVRGAGDLTFPPLLCFTSRDIAELPPEEPCARALLGAAPLTVTETLVGVASVLTAHIDAPLAAATIPVRDGATGADAWALVRVRGQRAIYPEYVGGVITDANLDDLVAGVPADVEAALVGRGTPANAITGPIFLDLDGGGYRAIFAP